MIYNEDNQSIISDPIVFISSIESSNSTQSAELLYGLGLSDADILKRFEYLIDDPFYNNTKEEALEKARNCYKDNLLDTTQIFSEEPMILSEQARLEYDEWQKAVSATP